MGAIIAIALGKSLRPALATGDTNLLNDLRSYVRRGPVNVTLRALLSSNASDSVPHAFAAELIIHARMIDGYASALAATKCMNRERAAHVVTRLTELANDPREPLKPNGKAKANADPIRDMLNLADGLKGRDQAFNNRLDTLRSALRGRSLA